MFNIATGDYTAESFHAYEFLDHLKRRWRFIAITSVAAAALALIVSLLLPKQYTATATLAIEPPAGNDPRMALTVSPIYLESLRAFESVASSDTLFERAIDRFHLRDEKPSRSRESWKRDILKVEKLKDTKILTIAVTLPDPRQAQAMAQFLGEETVNLSRGENLSADLDLLGDARNRTTEAQRQLDVQQEAWRDFNAKEPYEPIRADIEAMEASRETVDHDLTAARTTLAELASGFADARLAASRARVESLEKQDADLMQRIQTRSSALSAHEARADEIQQKLRAAQVAFDSASARQREIEATAGTRGERLRILDPGVAPERPSFPNPGLNVLLALAVGFLASLAYLALSFRAS